ncbi:MAG TPA: thioredoxin family protein [Acidiferrobacterales bacterium]|jgi:thioredoxin-related protein
MTISPGRPANTRRLRRQAFLWLCAVLIAAPAAWAAETRDPMTHFFDQGFANMPDEVATAKKEGKTGVLIMFETADCPWCEKMMTTVLNQVRVQEYYKKHFRTLQIDTNGDVPMTDFTGQELAQREFAFKHNRVRATPVFAFFDLDGRLVTKHTGITQSVDEFLWLGEFVVSGQYAKTNFTAYKRERQAQAATP